MPSENHKIGSKIEGMDEPTLQRRFGTFLWGDSRGLDILADDQGPGVVDRNRLKLPPGKGLVRLSTFFSRVFQTETAVTKEILEGSQQKWMLENAPILFNVGTPAGPVPHIKFEYISFYGVHMMLLVAPKSDSQFYQGYLYKMGEQSIWEKVEEFGIADPVSPTKNDVSIYDLYNLITRGLPEKF